MAEQVIFITGRRLVLRPLRAQDFSARYLAWLNDPVTNEFSQRRARPLADEDMTAYPDFYRNHPDKGFVLAMVHQDTGLHLGNISLVNLEPVHRSGEIAILLGEKSHWGKGLGAEAIYLLTRHAFDYLNLHRVFAGSFNPAFIACVKKLGWQREGIFRERIWSAGSWHDQHWYAQLAEEFSPRPEFEPMAGGAELDK